MTKVRTFAYAAIAAGCLAIGISAVGIISASSNTTAVLQVQDSSASPASVEVPVQAAAIPREVDAGDEAATTAAGYTAYQDENGNFVAPPPGTVVPAPVGRPAGEPQQFQNSVPGGGVGIDARGFTMSLTAVTSEDGAVSVKCVPQQVDEHAQNHEEQE